MIPQLAREEVYTFSVAYCIANSTIDIVYM